MFKPQVASWASTHTFNNNHFSFKHCKSAFNKKTLKKGRRQTHKNIKSQLKSQSQAFAKSKMLIKRILGAKCKIERTREKKENIVVGFLQILKLCMKCEKTVEFVSKKTKTSKLKKWKGKTHARVLLKLECNNRASCLNYNNDC
jgi:hypothetical protein